MIEASVATICTKGINSNSDFYYNFIVIRNLRLFENYYYSIFNRLVFYITNSPPLGSREPGYIKKIVPVSKQPA